MSATKEPRYFAVGEQDTVHAGVADFVVKNREDYLTLFSSARTETAVGEASPQYLYSPVAPGKIRAEIPNAKLIIVLRNPVERAYSAYMHHVREGVETLNFADAIASENERIAQGYGPLWHYVSAGLYASQLEQYFAAFPPGQIQLFLFEELVQDTYGVLQQIFEFLGVDSRFKVEADTKHNVSGTPRSPRFQQVLRQSKSIRRIAKRFVPDRYRANLASRIEAVNLRPKEPMPLEQRMLLQARFRDDINRTSLLINRDLSHWL